MSDISPSDDDPATRLARFWRFLAEAEFGGYCPIYERIATAVSDDRDLIARLVGITAERKVEPVLCLAAVKYLAVGTPLDAIYRGEVEADPWPAFRAVLVERFAEVADLMRSRSIQTNEVGRTATTAPALAIAAATATASATASAGSDGAPAPSVHLVEVGPSAGLNLVPDRYRITYRRDGRPAGSLGPDGSPVQLDCDILGPTPRPLPDAIPAITGRVGLDLHPLDVADDDHVRWLEACLWPGLTDRLDRFRAAVATAREHRLDLRAGNATGLLPVALEEVPDGALPVVLATWALAYLTPDEREEVHAHLRAHAAAGRPLAAITAEYPSIAPWIPEPPRPAAIEDPRGASLLGLAVWTGGRPEPTVAVPLAWVQAHGRWIDWL